MLLAALTAGPFGLFSTADALAIGLTHETLRTLTRSGVIVRVTHGLYAPRDPALTRTELHRRHAAAVLRRIPHAVLSHHSALIAADLPAFAIDHDTVHLTHRTSPSNRRRAGCVIPRADHTVDRLGVDATSVAVADAVLPVGLANPLSTLVAADAAVRAGMVTLADLSDTARRYTAHPGRAPMTAILDHVDPSAESPAESLARYALTRLGHNVIPQVPIATEGRRYRVDLMIGRLVVEVDGMRKYLPAVRGADDPRTVEDVVRAEKAREAAIVRAGHPVLRLTWGDIVTAGGDIRYGTVGRMLSVLLERAPAA